MSRPIERVVIVGGGTAGWMTAAALSHFLRGPRITLVESEEIGTIGVGEASIPPLAGFNALIGIDEREFMARTMATFKLGIEFVDWTRPGHTYLHPFGSYGAPLHISEFHHHWLRARAHGVGGELDDYCLNAVLARQDRFALRVADPKSPLSTLTYAYHFDAGLYGRYLRGLAEGRGVTRVEGRIVAVDQHPQTGFIKEVRLQNGEAVGGDLLIDCSGFRGLLIEETLKAGYVNWSGLLPCDRAVAVPSARTATLTPYTRSTARAAGWQWRIPLQHRTGNGYVYSSEHISDDDAAATLLANLDGEALADPRVVRFHTGRRKQVWVKNCIALGLSAGFLEPLESTSIHLIQKGITKLLACFPDLDFAPELINEFNRQTAFDYEDVRDFLALHYKATEREDTPFWRYNRHNTVSDSLDHRMKLFAQSGRIFIQEQELFKLTSWIAVLWHQGIRPQRYDPMADALPLDDLKRHMAALRDTFAAAARQQMSHGDFIDRHFGRPDLTSAR